MKILCTFPGKFGDLLWALPTIRAISRRLGAPVGLALAWPLRSIVPLLQLQPYLSQVAAVNDWRTQDTAPISPRTPPLEWLSSFAAGRVEQYDVMLNLGYREWPLPDVVRHTLATANEELFHHRWQGGKIPPAFGVQDSLITFAEYELALEEPWITLPDPPAGPDLAIAFTDEHFELKLGVALLVLERLHKSRFPNLDETNYRILYTAGSRWDTEPWKLARGGPRDWLGYARTLAKARVALADCSGAHVLAVAMGVPAVLMEPQPMRFNGVFYPLGMDGPPVTLVKGNDGGPTFDARHVGDVVLNLLTKDRANADR